MAIREASNDPKQRICASRPANRCFGGSEVSPVWLDLDHFWPLISMVHISAWFLGFFWRPLEGGTVVTK